ncbi:mobilisation protein (MobC) [Pedobacter steynii]|uniref:Mobilisation protein (MobC) n=1 Tax=Pedobacter steynii TaxID=430522 RepID=A0A1H0G7X3_9SPHI|nr:plasmid mobilization relaxosome protein MobC [Pedobacter steynii]NQX42348.1 plasmid mobilization relaxosome protein MobC [Pedobacter steynii]SDO02924.1 mobilisation protein (MobC) [Pedobacter steynii]
MPRKKSPNPDELLTRFVRTRVTEKVYMRLDKIRLNSDCHSVGGVARKLLSQEKITLFYKDMTLNATMEELALIRKELKAIGININQITRSFNQDKAETHRAFYVLKVANQYKKVDKKVDELLTLISKLADKWLQK